MKTSSKYDRFAVKIQAMRYLGRTYKEIDQVLGIPEGTSWKVLNKERVRANNRDSWQRWDRRGRVALTDTLSGDQP